MGFKLNIGKDGGGGSTGFSLKQSLNMIKAKGMSSQMIGTDVMKDGYYNTVNESGAGSPSNFNKGFRALPESVQEDIKDGMPMNDDGPYMTTAMYQKSCFNLNEKDKVKDGNVKVIEDNISGQGNNVKVKIPEGSTTQTTGKKGTQEVNTRNNSLDEVIITKNLKDKEVIRPNYTRGGQERSVKNSNYNARNVMTPEQKKKMDDDERGGK